MIPELEQANFLVHIGVPPLLAATFQARYPVLPPDYRAFLAQVESCMQPHATAWFNTAADFNGPASSAFAWNEWELLSLAAYADEPDEAARAEATAAITGFWDQHVPILLSCKNFYCHFSLCLHPARFGQVVYGSEPEFEETEAVAGSFGDFVARLARRELAEKCLEQIL